MCKGQEDEPTLEALMAGCAILSQVWGGLYVDGERILVLVWVEKGDIDFSCAVEGPVECA